MGSFVVHLWAFKNILRFHSKRHETTRYTEAVDRMVGGIANVEEEVKSTVICYGTHVTDIYTSRAISRRKTGIRILEPQGISVFYG